MRELAFSTQPTAGHEPQGIVVSIGKETADIKAGATRLRNVAIAKPLTAEQLNLYDIVALLWVGDVPHATSILGHESAYRKDPYQDTTPPPFPIDVQVVQTNYGAKLVWAWGGKDSNRGDLAFYEVDARLPGQQWGLDVYPVGEGTSEEHYPRLPHLAVQVRVRAVDLRGNKSNWVEADDLLQDLVAPPAPMGFNVSSEVGGVRCTWISPLPGSIPDLAGFFLYACTDELGTGGIIKAKTVGPTTSTFYEFVYSGTLYFNLTAFDLAGNESDYAVTIWLPGYSYGSQGAQLLINSDFERSMMGWEDIVLGPLPDYWNMVIGNVTYGDIEYGDFGREGGKGIRTAFTGNTSAVIYWPYSGDDGLNVWLLRAEPSQIYTVSIYFKPDCSIDLFRYEYYADLGTLQDLVYLGLVVRRHNGTGIDPTGYSTGTGTLVEELEGGWYRAAFSVMPADNPTYPYICATFVVYNRTGGSVTVDLDRAQVVIGKDPAQWQPGIGGAYGATTGGLRLDMSGLSSDNLKVGKDGKLYSDLLSDATGTRNLGSPDLHWQTVYADNLVGSAAHDPVSLDASATDLLTLTVQDLSLDAQAANLVFAGPTTGGAAVPTFRSLVDADIPAAICRDSELTTHAGLTTGVHGVGASTVASVADIATHAAVQSGVHGLAITAGKTLTVQGSLTLAGVDAKVLTLTDSLTVQGGGATTLSSAGGYTLTIPATGTAALRSDKLSVFAATTSAELAGVISDETGSGALVFGTSPTFTTQITVPLIIAPSTSLALRPTTNATTAIQLQNAAGTSVLNVDTTNGRVGIGTTTPGALLHVGVGADSPSLFSNIYASNEGATFITARNSSDNIDVAIGPGTTYGIVGTRTYHDFYFQSNATNYMALTKTGNVGIGTTGPGTLLHALKSDAVTVAVTNVATLGHNSTGTPAAGFGGGLVMNLESSTTEAQTAAALNWLWNDATHATRKADLVAYAYDTAARELWRGRGAGAAPAIGFLGAAPSARLAHVADPAGGATVDAEARTAINSILASLETFGFHATS